MRYILVFLSTKLLEQTTKELKVSGMIGHGISAAKKSPCVGETEIGIGQTSAWKVNVIVRALLPVSTSK